MHQRGTFPICSAPSKVRKITEIPETFEEDGNILVFSDNFGHLRKNTNANPVTYALNLSLRQEAKQILIEDLPINTAIQNSDFGAPTPANSSIVIRISPVQNSTDDERSEKRSGHELNRLLVPGEVFLIGVKAQTNFQKTGVAFDLNARKDNVPLSQAGGQANRVFDLFDAEGNIISGALNLISPRSTPTANTWFTLMWSGRRFVLLGSNNWVNKT